MKAFLDRIFHSCLLNLEPKDDENELKNQNNGLEKGKKVL